MRLFDVKLDHIRDIHLEARKAFSALDEIQPLIKKRNTFNSDSLRNYLLIKPLTIIKVENKNYHLVAGFREWLLSLDLCEKSEYVKCIVINKNDSIEIEELAWQDVYCSLLIFSAHPKKFAVHLAQFIRQLPSEVREKYYPQLGNILQVAKSTHLSRNSFYEGNPKELLQICSESKNKHKASIDSFEDLMGE